MGHRNTTPLALVLPKTLPPVAQLHRLALLHRKRLPLHLARALLLRHCRRRSAFRRAVRNITRWSKEILATILPTPTVLPWLSFMLAIHLLEMTVVDYGLIIRIALLVDLD